MATENAVMAVIRSSRPSFRNAHDKVAFAVHAAFLTSGYTLIATGSRASSENALFSSFSDEVGIEGWNEAEDNYGFVYSKKDNGSEVRVLVKCLVMGDHLIIDALCSKDQDKEPCTFEINVNDYNGKNESANYAEQYKNFAKLVDSLNSSILKKIEREPATGSNSHTASSSEETKERSEQHAPYPPREETKERSERHESYPPSFVHPPVLPGHIDDLFPGPGAGFYPRVGPGIGGPMLVGPNDPRWFRPGGEQPGFPGGSLGGVPPGARFDPYGPPGVPGFEPNRFARNPRRPPGSHPDLEPFPNPDSDFI